MASGVSVSGCSLASGAQDVPGVKYSKVQFYSWEMGWKLDKSAICSASPALLIHSSVCGGKDAPAVTWRAAHGRPAAFIPAPVWELCY